MSARGEAAPVASDVARPQQSFEPARLAWSLLTNVKVALLLVGTAVAAGLAGTVLPQLPAPMRDNPAARAAWLEVRRETYGPLTGVIESAGLFDVFHAPWFTGLWATIILAVTVCTVSRFRPTWRNVARPPRSVPDSYFERAHQRLTIGRRTDTDSVATSLRRRRYRVEEVRRDGEAVYLFADRFAWAQYGTFASHLALLMLLVGALLTLLVGYSRAFVLVEATPAAPVFDRAGPGQLFIRVLDAYRGSDEQGNVIDFHTDIEVRRGNETVRCRVTVNGPCGAFGYRVHQAAFFDDVARLRILGPEGRILYAGTLDFAGKVAAVPVLRVTGAGGDILVDEPMPQLATDPGASASRDDDFALGSLEIAATPASPPLALGLAWHIREGELRLLVSTPESLRPLTIGETLIENGYRVEYRGPTTVPAIRVEDMPGAGSGGAVVQMIPRADGTSYLVISGVDEDNVAVAAGRSASTYAGFTYQFEGRAEAAGIDVRRDPGDTFVWLAVAIGLAGLAVTFYVPRRRLWVRIRPDQVTFAGVAERTVRLNRELAALAAELDAPTRTASPDR